MATANSEDDTAPSREAGGPPHSNAGGSSSEPTSGGRTTTSPHEDGRREFPTGPIDATEQLSQSRYAVTYAFNGYLRGAHGRPTAHICETASGMQEDGIDVEFLGATLAVDAAGQLIAVTAHYSAPSKGAIAQLNCRARLPACGPPRALDQRPAVRESRGTVAPPAQE